MGQHICEECEKAYEQVVENSRTCTECVESVDHICLKCELYHQQILQNFDMSSYVEVFGRSKYAADRQETYGPNGTLKRTQ